MQREAEKWGFGWKEIRRVKGEFCPNMDTITSYLYADGKELGRN